MTTVADINYAAAVPIPEAVDLINKLFSQGHEIVLFTARGSKTGIDWREVTERQLKESKLLYHELKFGKPYADYYVDDKFITLDEIKEKIKNRTL